MGSGKAHRSHDPKPFRKRKSELDDPTLLGKENEKKVFDACYSKDGKLIPELRELKVLSVEWPCGLWDDGLIDLVFPVQNGTRVYPCCIQVKSSLKSIAKFENKRARLEGENYQAIGLLIVTSLDTPERVRQKIIHLVQTQYRIMKENPKRIPTVEIIEREVLEQFIYLINRRNLNWITTVSSNLGKYGFNHPVIDILLVKDGRATVCNIYLANNQFEVKKIKKLRKDLIPVAIGFVDEEARRYEFRPQKHVVQDILTEVQNVYYAL